MQHVVFPSGALSHCFRRVLLSPPIIQPSDIRMAAMAPKRVARRSEAPTEEEKNVEIVSSIDMCEEVVFLKFEFVPYHTFQDADNEELK